MHSDRKKQVETTKARHGVDFYKELGKKNEKRHKFTPEEASAAAKKGWAKRKLNKEK